MCVRPQASFVPGGGGQPGGGWLRGQVEVQEDQLGAVHVPYSFFRSVVGSDDRADRGHVGLALHLEVARGDVERGRVDHAGDLERGPAVVEPDADRVADQHLWPLSVLDLGARPCDACGRSRRPPAHDPPCFSIRSAESGSPSTNSSLSKSEERLRLHSPRNHVTERSTRSISTGRSSTMTLGALAVVKFRMPGTFAMQRSLDHVALDLVIAPDVRLGELLGELPAAAESWR